ASQYRGFWFPSRLFSFEYLKSLFSRLVFDSTPPPHSLKKGQPFFFRQTFSVAFSALRLASPRLLRLSEVPPPSDCGGVEENPVAVSAIVAPSSEEVPEPFVAEPVADREAA